MKIFRNFEKKHAKKDKMEQIEELYKLVKINERFEEEKKAQKEILSDLAVTFRYWKLEEQLLQSILEEKIKAEEEKDNIELENLKLQEKNAKNRIEEAKEKVEKELCDKIKGIEQQLDEMKSGMDHNTNDSIKEMLESNLEVLYILKQMVYSNPIQLLNFNKNLDPQQEEQLEINTSYNPKEKIKRQVCFKLSGRTNRIQLNQASQYINPEQSSNLIQNTSEQYPHLIKETREERFNRIKREIEQGNLHMGVKENPKTTINSVWEKPSIEFQKEMNEYFRKNRIGVIWREQVSAVCAMLLITLIVTVDATRNSSHAFQVPFVNYIVQKIESLGYGKFDVNEEEKEEAYQIGTLAYYYDPTWIPEGMELTKELKNKHSNVMHYKGNTTNYLMYLQAVVDFQKEYNIETLDYDQVIEGKKMYYYSVSRIEGINQSSLVWYEGFYKFTLNSNLSKRDIIKAADSVKMASKVKNR